MSLEEEMHEDDQDDVFVDCIPKNDDVFVFLSSLDRSETSVSTSTAGSSSSSSSSLRGFSNCSDDKGGKTSDDHDVNDDDDDITTYLDATTTQPLPENVVEQNEFGLNNDDDDEDIGLNVSSSLFDEEDQHQQESLCSLSCSSFNEEEEEDISTLGRLELPPSRVEEEGDDAAVTLEESNRRDGDNAIGFAVHVVQNIWEGSKKTPVGFAVHLTEGIFGRLVGMIHQESCEQETNPSMGFENPTEDTLLFGNEDFDVMRQTTMEEATIAEPDPLDASEFVLEATHRDTNTSAILLDDDLDTATACDLSMNMDLFRRLDLSISMESSSPQRNAGSDDDSIAFH